jgi:hypothetical protein
VYNYQRIEQLSINPPHFNNFSTGVTMFSYQPNFCCECGQAIEKTEWKIWEERRFCDDCARHLESRNKFWLMPVAAFVIFGSGIMIGKIGTETPTPIVVTANQTTAETPPPKTVAQLPPNPNVNLQTPAKINRPIVQSNLTPAILRPQTTVQPSPQTQIAPTVPTEVSYFCGAKTQKGTPCSRKVKGGGRCWQHTGKPAMLPDDKLLIK